MSPQQSFIRRGVHHFVYGLCAAVLGITPPTEKQEVPFLLILIGAFLFFAVAMYFVATFVATAFK